MKTEQENCTVTVRGIQRVEGDEDVVELVTGGRFTCHGGRWLIRYEESDDTGYGGCHTSLRYDPEKGQVILLRTGAVHSQLMVEEGKRHQCTYDTGCGTIILGVSGSRIGGRPGRAGRHAGISLLAGCKHGAGKRKRCLCGGVPAVIRKLAGPAPGSRANSKSYINHISIH